MAKQIKVIKCPSCGSTHKKEIKPEHYQCDNCNTEYFLDNDDININVSHRTSDSTPRISFFASRGNRISLIITGIVAAALLFTGLFVQWNHSRNIAAMREAANQNANKTIKTTPLVEKAPIVTNPPVVKKEPFIHYNYCSTIVSDGKPYILTLEDQQVDMQNYKYYFVTYDLLDNKIAKKVLIENVNQDKYGRVSWDHHDFTAEKTYFVNNNKQVFLLDKKQYKFTEITNTLLKNHPEYQTGIASVNISYTTSGDAFHILTNDGKKIYYFPLIDEVYLDDYDFQMVKNRPKKPPIDNSVYTVFDFADRYGEDFKLIKFSYISPDGKNRIEPRSAKIGSYKQDGTSNKHTEPDNAYDLINTSNVNVTIVDHKNITPGRLYFDPSIIYYDNDTLVIKTKVNAAPDASYNYQRIDTESGNVIWTIPEDQISIESLVVYKDMLITKQKCNKYALIDKNGKITQQIKLTKE